MIAYLDSSAIVKLVVEEPESSVLRDSLREWSGYASSIVARVEVIRAAATRDRATADAARLRLELFLLMPLDDAVAAAAAEIQPLTIRSLDAIHLASATSLDEDLGVLITYDRRMVGAARAAGLPVASPS